jgi:hypothetical protein
MKSVAATEDGKRNCGRVTLRGLILASIVCVLVFLSCGCSRQHAGESVAETSRRHKRILRLNQQGLLSDLEMALMLDEPSRLTDRRIP